MEELSDSHDKLGYGDQDEWVDEDEDGFDQSDEIGCTDVPVNPTAGNPDKNLWGPNIPNTLQIIVVTANGVFCHRI